MNKLNAPGAKHIQPWKDLRVLDLSQGIAGPYCAQILATQGADVIKVEPPSGDWGRFVGRTWADHSALSLHYNQGKRGLAVDAKSKDGQQLLRDLANHCDVIIQNFRPGVVQRLGLDYESLAIERPTLVYLSISGYGPDGPYADRPASDSVMQADSGLMFMNRSPDNQPQRVGMLIADAVTGLYAAQSVSAALYHRLRNGEGCHVQTSLFESCLALQGMNLLEHAMIGSQPVGAVSAPNGVFATSDGQITLLSLNDEHFKRIAKALDKPQWLEDDRFSSNALRLANKHVLHNEIDDILKRNSSDHWLDRLKEHDVLHAAVNDYDALVSHPQTQHLGLMHAQAIEGVGRYQTVDFPAAIFGHTSMAAPRIGEHSLSVLSDFGFAADRIDRLLQDGVIAQFDQQESHP